MLDPSSAQHAADLLAQHDWATLHDTLQGAAMHLSDAAAAAADVVDISAIKSTVSGTGMTKPIDMNNLMENVEWPTGFDPWGYWMSSLKYTIFKLHDVTGSFGLAIIAIVVAVKAITYPLNYKVFGFRV
jgi:membrane protein insertase Oxa1/YidC/SpoIIIJ